MSQEDQEVAVRPEIVMPAIYRFKFITAPKGAETWGWHRVKELVEAVNTILTAYDRAPMTNAELCRAFPEVNLLNRPVGHVGSREIPKWCAEVNQSGVMGRIADCCVYEYASDWLTPMVKNDKYIPAGIGMELIEVVKKLCKAGAPKPVH